MADALHRLTEALADKYRIKRELGAGGMATVYLAQDLKHDRKVALKVLKPELAAVIGADRFVVEIKTTAALQHPHILPLFDSGTADGFLYYVMPFIDGETLRTKLDRERQFGIEEAVKITVAVADALDYAHRKGIIHRDIKPENILLHDGRPMVADFGIALALSAAAGGRMTETGMSLGTPHYMSPEQATAEKEITGRSDIYSLGSVLYEMLTGNPPHTGATAQQIIMKIIAEPVQPVTAYRKSVPPNVAAAVAKSLEKLPADRFESAKAFGAALTDSGFTVAGEAARRHGGQAVGRSGGRTAITAWGLSIVLAGVALWGWFGRSGSTQGPAVYDAALPDSEPMTFSPTAANAVYGVSFRNLSISPSGEFAVYAGRRGDETSIWYRSLREGSARAIPGTTGGGAPRLSPDGGRIVYLAGDEVLVVPIAGGEPRRVMVGSGPESPEWISSNEVIVTDLDGNRLNWIDVDAGSTRTKSITRCVFGQWVPESKRLLCSFNRSAMLIDPETGDHPAIRATRADGSPGQGVPGTAFRIVDHRYLVYVSMDGDLMAARFDPTTWQVGRAVALVSGVRREASGDAQFDLSDNGALLYAPGVDGTVGQLVTLKAGGTPQPLAMEAADFQRYDLSRDHRWVAAAVQVPNGTEVRIYDVRDRQHFTWLQNEVDRQPLWSQDGERLLVGLRDSTRFSVVLGAPSSGTRPDTLVSIVSTLGNPDPADFHDDHLALAQDWNGSVVFRFDPGLPHPRFDTVVTGARFPMVSPNGKLLVYQALDGSHVVVTSFPVAGHRWQLATQGVEPLWLSATEVLFRSGVSWYSVHVDPNSGEPAGAPVVWGRDPRFSDTSGWSNRPTHDGGILYVQGPAQTGTTYLRVIPGWVSQMERAVDAANR